MPYALTAIFELFFYVVLYLYRLILYCIRIIRLFQLDYRFPEPSVPRFRDSTNKAIPIPYRAQFKCACSTFEQSMSLVENVDKMVNKP